MLNNCRILNIENCCDLMSIIRDKPTLVILVNTSIHLRSDDASTVDCGLHRNDRLKKRYSRIKPRKRGEVALKLWEIVIHPPVFR
jgi:hypothetical protein